MNNNAMIVSRQEQQTSVEALPVFNAELMQEWIKYVDARSKRTEETYSRALKQFFVYLWERGIRQPTREDVIAYREHLEQKHKATTVQSYLTAVKLFFQWTELRGLYPNIAERVKSEKLDDEHKKLPLTAKQVKRLMERVDRSTLKGKRDFALLALMVTTGLRTVSIASAKVEDVKPIDDENMALFYQGKGHKQRAKYVKLAGPVEDALMDYLQARGAVPGSAPLFASTAHRNEGQAMTTRSISRIVKEHLIDAGLNNEAYTAHSLRHTAATTNLRNGGTLEETQQLLDHKNINTTMIYIREINRADNNSEDRIANVLLA